MSSEKIRARMTQLTAQMEKLTSDINAMAGALQDCQYWLTETEKAEAEEKKSAG